MIRYLGQGYEGSDDEMNDRLAAARRRAQDKPQGKRCENCQRWEKGKERCEHHLMKTKPDDFCAMFVARAR